MEIIYEQGDIIFNNNNFNYGIVLREKRCTKDVTIIEIDSENVFINSVPKPALKYKGSVRLTSELLNIVEEALKGGAE